MTYSEHLRIMEMEYAEADNSMIDIDFMLESAEASHRLDVADLDFKFESCDDYDQDAKVQMYMTEAKTFGDKVKAAWNKFVEWLRGIVAKIFKLKPDDAKAKKVAAAHPKGIKVPFNIGETEKHMDKLSGFFSSASIAKLTKDIDQLTKDGIKVNVNIKSGKLQTYQKTTALNAFLDAASGIVKAAVAPAGAVVGVGVLLKFMNKSFNFAKKLQEWAQDLANKADGKLNFIIVPLQQIASTVTGINSSLAHVMGTSSVEDPTTRKLVITDEKVNSMSAAKFNGVLANLKKALQDGTSANMIKRGEHADAIDEAHAAYREAIITANRKSAEFKEKYNQKVIADAANECIKYAYQAPAYKLGHKGEGEKALLAFDKAVNSQKSTIALLDAKPAETKEESVNNDGTVFSSFFESTDMLSSAPDTTSAFLSTPDQNMNEIMSLLDRF